MNRDDSRIRKVPMFFGRPNLTEMNRVYRELVTVTLGPAESQPIPEEILALWKWRHQPSIRQRKLQTLL